MAQRLEERGVPHPRPATRIAVPSRSSAQPQPLPIGRRPSISSAGGDATSREAGRVAGIPPPSPRVGPTGNLTSATKSYAASKPSKGVPIFVGSGAHSHAQARAASVNPSISARRSQTPQQQQKSSQRRGSVAKDAETSANPIPPQRNERGTSIVSTRSRADSSSYRYHPQQRDGKASQSVAIHAPVEHAEESDRAVKRLDGRAASTSQGRLEKGKRRAVGRKPTKPPSAYILYSKEVRPKIAEEAASFEGATFNINTRIREGWLALPEAEKDKYREDAIQQMQVYESLMDDWLAEHPDEEATESAKRKARSGSRHRSEPLTSVKDAFHLFQEKYLAQSDAAESGAGPAWEKLSEEERQAYERQANEASSKSKKLKRVREKHRTISDDEAEYLAEVSQHGPELKSRRIDTRNTAMTDLSENTFKRGRASKRTFDMERKLKAVAKDRQRQLKEERATRAKGEQVGAAATLAASQTAGGTAVSKGKENGAVTSEAEEEIIDEGDSHAADSDVESVGAASEGMPALRENKFTIRTRIVNGELVLDESSLQQTRGNDIDFDGAGQEYIDVNEEDRFVNSATYSKRVGTERWDAQETKAFLKAVSMWGSDFEMISRMFANRNRKQIRAKWRSMERTDSRSLDLAFKRKLPVDLEEYGLMAGVDLSGAPPKIEVHVKKAEGEEENDEEEGREHAGESGRRAGRRQEQPERIVERDENGLEIVEEGDDEEEERISIRKKSATPMRSAKSKSPSLAAETDVEDDVIEEEEGDELPTVEDIVRQSGSRQKERAQSISSATSHRPRQSNTVGGAGTAAAEAERARQEKKQKDLQRKERERARRRSVPTNEEEVLD